MLQWIPTAILAGKTVYGMLNKPKKLNAKPLTDPIERSISNIESDIQSKTLMNQLTSEAKSLGSRMYQQSQRGLETMQSSGALTEGQFAQGMLTAGTEIQERVGETQSQAMLQQVQSNQQQQRAVDSARERIAMIKESVRQQNQAQESEWKAGIAGGVMDTLTTGFNTAVQQIEDKGINDTINKYLKGRNVSDLTNDEIEGLLATLVLRKMGHGG